MVGGGIGQRIGRREHAIKPRRRRPVKVAVLCLAAVTASLAGHPAKALDSGDFGDLHIVRPEGAMHGLVVLFSDAKGWDAASAKIADALGHDGAFVLGVDLSAYLRHVGAQGHARCSDAVSAIELLSREVQRERGNSTYWTPILAGVGEGGAFAAATLGQAPASTIAGAISLDPTAALHMKLPLCPGIPPAPSIDRGFSYGPWRSLNGFWAVGFDHAADRAGRAHIGDLKAQGTPVAIDDFGEEGGAADAMAALLRPHLRKSRGVAGPAISGLPLVEMPASPPGPLLAIVLSGDGGWRDLDRSIAEKLRSDGVSVIGWDSLRYFWSHKTPEQTARDLSAVIDTYIARWGASKVALIGYSFGAGVLPFAYDRLSPEAKQHVVQLSLLGFASAADFEISMMGWLGAPPTENALPTQPALASIDPSMIQCFDGRETATAYVRRWPKPTRRRSSKPRGPPFRRRLRRARRTHLRGFRHRAG